MRVWVTLQQKTFLGMSIKLNNFCCSKTFNWPTCQNVASAKPPDDLSLFHFRCISLYTDNVHMLSTGFWEFIEVYWSIFVFYATKSKNKLGEEENLLFLRFRLSNFDTVICSNVSTSEISQVLTLFWYQDCLYRVCNGREVLHSFWACQTGFLWQKPFFLSFNMNVSCCVE